ncbi:hypothetical protein [Thiobacillus sp.]|uniref:hypothetical protein n=1 Tax=Thiobacillus sp. TaxID=924 RepID=UPI00286E6010|nr:hypothetical protein [Thiobacillus sp.]
MVGLLLLLTACASGPKEQEVGSTPPPGVHFGNEIVLLDSATEKVAAHMTPDGRVHLVAITAGDDAYHVVVSAQGVEQKEKIGARRYGYYQNLAITDDAQGRLHVALKDEHWIQEKGAWRLAGENRCALLARAGDSMACALDVDGSELETTAQWGASIIGGPAAAILIPYRFRPDKLVLAKALGDDWSYRNVLDHQLPYVVNLTNPDSGVLAGDASGTFHLFFIAHGSNFYSTRYDTLTFAEDGGTDIEWRQPDGQAIKLGNLESEPARPGANWFIPWGMLALAVDPQTGKALFFARRMESGFGNRTDASVEILGGVFGQPVPLSVKNGNPRRLAPAGDERFHALVTARPGLLYLAYRAGGWTAPARVGEYGTPSMFLIGDSSIQIVSDGRSQALAIWPKREGALVGRWIELDETKRWPSIGFTSFQGMARSFRDEPCGVNTVTHVLERLCYW